jgi:chemotaxis protein CheD
MSDVTERERMVVRVGDLAVGGPQNMLVTIGLGSCVAVALYDDVTRTAGLAHVMLPDPARARNDVPPARFAGHAIRTLLDLMEEAGADRAHIRARLVGGAAMFAAVLSPDTMSLGERNILACRSALIVAGVPLAGEEVGGTYGRSVYFDPADGHVRVTSVNHGDVIL